MNFVEGRKNKSFDDDYFRGLIINYITEFGVAKRPEIDKLLMDKLSDALTFDQKVRKIGKLLTSLRMSGRIEIGEKRAWVLKKKNE